MFFRVAGEQVSLKLIWTIVFENNNSVDASYDAILLPTCNFCCQIAQFACVAVFVAVMIYISHLL